MNCDDKDSFSKEVSSSLTFSQTQVNFILGHSLRNVYQDLLKAPLPEHLKDLLDQMELNSSEAEKK